MLAVFGVSLEGCEFLKDLSHIFRSNARALIFDCDENALGVWSRTNRDGAAFRRMFKGVADQVQEDALEEQRVGFDAVSFEADPQWFDCGFECRVLKQSTV